MLRSRRGVAGLGAARASALVRLASCTVCAHGTARCTPSDATSMKRLTEGLRTKSMRASLLMGLTRRISSKAAPDKHHGGNTVGWRMMARHQKLMNSTNAGQSPSAGTTAVSVVTRFIDAIRSCPCKGRNPERRPFNRSFSFRKTDSTSVPRLKSEEEAKETKQRGRVELVTGCEHGKDKL